MWNLTEQIIIFANVNIQTWERNRNRFSQQVLCIYNPITSTDLVEIDWNSILHDFTKHHLKIRRFQAALGLIYSRFNGFAIKLSCNKIITFCLYCKTVNKNILIWPVPSSVISCSELFSIIDSCSSSPTRLQELWECKDVLRKLPIQLRLAIVYFIEALFL